MIVYHKDRRNKRYVGETIHLDKEYFLDLEEIKDTIYTWFPEGLSDHGNAYFDTYSNNLDIMQGFFLDHISNFSSAYNSHIIEIVFELIRRTKYSHMPSRFQCFFGVEALEDFDMWSELSSEKFSICKLEVPDEQIYKFDATFLQGGINSYTKDTVVYSSFNIPLIFKMAEKYWSQEVSENPKFEILMKTPIKVLDIFQN